MDKWRKKKFWHFFYLATLLYIYSSISDYLINVKENFLVCNIFLSINITSSLSLWVFLQNIISFKRLEREFSSLSFKSRKIFFFNEASSIILKLNITHKSFHVLELTHDTTCRCKAIKKINNNKIFIIKTIQCISIRMN